MKIAPIIEQDHPIRSPDTTVSMLRRKFETGEQKCVLVGTDEEISGVVTHRELSQARIDSGQTVGSLVQPVSRLSEDDDIEDAVQVLVESNAEVTPVYSGETFVGVVSRDAVLREVLVTLDEIVVGDIHTSSVITLSETATLSDVTSVFKKNDISRVPIVRQTGSLAGIVTTADIIGAVVKDQKESADDAGFNRQRPVRQMSVRQLMTTPVETVSSDTPLTVAVRQMVDELYNGLVVTNQDTVTGIITKSDALRALCYTDDNMTPLIITSERFFETYTRETVTERVDTVTDARQQLQVRQVHTRLNKHAEHFAFPTIVGPDQSITRCEIRLQTNQGQIAGTGEEVGADDAFDSAVSALENNIDELMENSNTET